MREQTGASVGAAPAMDDMASGALFIITLSSSNAPMALEVPSLAELAGLAVFRSRKVEDGRDRFRLHLGYFESPVAAEAALRVVREHFPAAWVGPAPNSGMGSLDDTSVAQFKFIKAPNTLKSDGGTSTRLRALNAGSVSAATTAPPPRTPAPSSRPQVTPSKQPSPGSRTFERKVYTALAAPIAATNPPPRPPAPTQAPTTIAGREVLSLLESSPPVRRPTLQEQMQPRERAAVIGAIQKFAVQLIWSTEPVNLAEIAKLAIFEAYTLYKVQVDRAGRRWYGLRLGFFADPVSARQVALYARSDFSAAAVVPVSDRECDRAAQAAVKELPEALAAARADVEMELIDVPRTARKSDLDSALAPAAKPKPVTAARTAPASRTAAAGKPAPPRKPVPMRAATASKATVAAKAAPRPVLSKPAPVSPAVAKPAQRANAQPAAPQPESATPEPIRQEKSRRLKSTAEMAAELQSEPDFELGDGVDPLNDTGVRHLAITVVKKKTQIGKLFKRR